MKRRFSILTVIAMAGSLLGCSKEPVVVPLDRVSFPAVLILGKTPTNGLAHEASIVVDAEDLSTLRVEKYSNLPVAETDEPPIVVDSQGKVLDMREIEGEHGGLWIMANPTGLMPIRFTLVQRDATGIEAARELIAECRFIGRDLDDDRTAERHERIRQARSMDEIIRIVDELPESKPVE